MLCGRDRKNGALAAVVLSSTVSSSFSPFFPVFSPVSSASSFLGRFLARASSILYHWLGLVSIIFLCFMHFSILQFSGVAGFSGVQKLLASLMSLSKLPRQVDELVKTSSAL